MKIYFVAQVESPTSLEPIGFRSIHSSPELAIDDKMVADREIPKDENGSPHWKVLVYQCKMIGVIDLGTPEEDTPDTDDVIPISPYNDWGI